MNKYNINIDQRELWTILRALGRLGELSSLELISNIKDQYSVQRISQEASSDYNEIDKNGNKNK